MRFPSKWSTSLYFADTSSSLQSMDDRGLARSVFNPASMQVLPIASPTRGRTYISIAPLKTVQMQHCSFQAAAYPQGRTQNPIRLRGIGPSFGLRKVCQVFVSDVDESVHQAFVDSQTSYRLPGVGSTRASWFAKRGREAICSSCPASTSQSKSGFLRFGSVQATEREVPAEAPHRILTTRCLPTIGGDGVLIPFSALKGNALRPWACSDNTGPVGVCRKEPSVSHTRISAACSSATALSKSGYGSAVH